jgi:hypothetical protein
VPSSAVPPYAAVWSMPLCRVLWFFSINYLYDLRKKIELTFAKKKSSTVKKLRGALPRTPPWAWG